MYAKIFQFLNWMSLIKHILYNWDLEAYLVENKQNFVEIHIQMSKIIILLIMLNEQYLAVELENLHIFQAPQDYLTKWMRI